MRRESEDEMGEETKKRATHFPAFSGAMCGARVPSWETQVDEEKVTCWRCRELRRKAIAKPEARHG